MTIEQESKKTKRAMLARLERHKLWPFFAAKVEEQFYVVSQKAKEAAYPETLYLCRDDSERTIQLYCGAHPIDVTHIRDEYGQKSGLQVHTEEGAAIVVSQSTNGCCAIVLYPYTSQKYKHKKAKITWKVFDSPKDITTKVLDAAIKDFFTYMRVSSAVLVESPLDRLRIHYLVLRGEKYTAKDDVTKFLFTHWFWVVLGAVGSIASIYSLWK